MKVLQIKSALLVLFLSITIVKAQEIEIKRINNSEEWNYLKASAVKNNDLLFVGIHTDGNDAYEELIRNVYPSDEFKATFSDRYQVAIMVQETVFRSEFAEFYAVDGTPAFIILTPNSERLWQYVGFLDALNLSSVGTEVLSTYDNLVSDHTKFESGYMSQDEERAYLDLLIQFQMLEKAKEVSENILSKIPYAELFDEKYISILPLAPGGKNSILFKKILSDHINLRERFGDYYDFIMMNIINTQVADAVNNENIEDIEFLIENFVPFFLDGFSEFGVSMYELGLRKLYYANLNDWFMYGKIVSDFFLEIGQVEETFLYNEAIEIIENYPTEEAIPYALKWLEYSESEESNFQNNFAIAYSYAILSNKEYAMRFAVKAKNLASLEEDIAKTDHLIEMLYLMD